MVNYYEILGVSRHASLTEIKAAFKKLAVLYHPDKNPGNKSAEESFKKVNEAYQILSNDDKRILYNQKLDYYYFQVSQARTTGYSGYNTTYTPPQSQYSATGYNKYSWAPPDTNNDYSTQGKHYEERVYEPKERKSDHYVLGITLFIIIATACLLFGFMMNRFAAREHYQQAVLNYQNEEYGKALIEINQALDCNPKFAEAFELRGDIKILFGRYESALFDYNQAIEYTDDPPTSLINKRNYCKYYGTPYIEN